jgi:hypothetical protein
MDEVTPLCDICDEVVDDDDRNLRTGNHETCEWTLEDQPAEDDIYLTDDQRTRRPCATQSGKIILLSKDGEAIANADIIAHMERDQFWPNVWRVSDHGNLHLVNMHEGD